MTTLAQKPHTQYVYDFAALERVPEGPTSAQVAAKRMLSGPTLKTGKSSTVGAVLTGTHLIVTLGRQARGSGAKAHNHPNEQFTFVVEGGLSAEVDGEAFTVGKHCVVHIPPGMPHRIAADGDALVVTLQDTRHAFAG